MSEVTRYEYDGGHGGSQEMLPFSGGAWVRAADYDALKAELLNWAVDRWHAEVANRPLINKNRRPLDDTWRQVIRQLGGDPTDLCGPGHDTLLAGQPQQGERFGGITPAPAAVVVMPARMTTIPEGKTISYAAGYEDALDAVARLNCTVPLELLERIAEHMEKDTYAPFGEPSGPVHAERRELTREIRAILGAKP